MRVSRTPVELTAGKEVCNHSAYLSEANRATVESGFQLAEVGDMFKKPYPRPRWADNRKQCAGMNSQVSAQVKAMRALPQPELQDIKPEPSVSQPLVANSVFGPSGSGGSTHRPPRPASTGSMPPTSAQTGQAAQRMPRGASPHESYVKQEPLENLVYSSINLHESSEPVLGCSSS
jgi:hypothetical protein